MKLASANVDVHDTDQVDAERALLEKANAALKAGLAPHQHMQSPSQSSSIACSGANCLPLLFL